MNIRGGNGTDGYYWSASAQIGGIRSSSLWGGGGRAAVNGNASTLMNGQAPGSGAGSGYASNGITGVSVR